MVKIAEELRDIGRRAGRNEIYAVHFKELCELLAKRFEEEAAERVRMPEVDWGACRSCGVALQGAIATPRMVDSHLCQKCWDAEFFPTRTTEVIPYTRKLIGSDLKIARERVGLSQRELADKIFYSLRDLENIEDGTSSIQEYVVEKYLAACGLPPDWKP